MFKRKNAWLMPERKHFSLCKINGLKNLLELNEGKEGTKSSQLSNVQFNDWQILTQTQIRAMRRMRIKATATTTMMNVPKGVASSIALSQISVAFVELVGGTGVVDVDRGTEIAKKKYTAVGIILKARLLRRFLSRQLDAIFVARKLELQNRTCNPGAIFSAICRRDIAGVSNMFET